MTPNEKLMHPEFRRGMSRAATICALVGNRNRIAMYDEPKRSQDLMANRAVGASECLCEIEREIKADIILEKEPKP